MKLQWPDIGIGGVVGIGIEFDEIDTDTGPDTAERYRLWVGLISEYSKRLNSYYLMYNIIK